MSDGPIRSGRARISALMGNAVADIKDVRREAVELVRELKISTKQTTKGGKNMAIGGALALVGVILLCFALVSLLSVSFPELPLWAWYGIVGLTVAAVGYTFLQAGRSRLDPLKPVQQKRERMQQDLSHAVQNLNESVQVAKDTLQESKLKVKDALSLEHQVERRPWVMMAGATSVGLLGSALMHGATSHRRGNGWNGGYERMALPTESERTAEFVDADTRRFDGGHRGTRGHGPMNRLTQRFDSELDTLKGLAIGTLFGILRDVASRSAPRTMSSQIGDVIDGITQKLGGRPIQGSVLNQPWDRDRTQRG